MRPRQRPTISGWWVCFTWRSSDTSSNTAWARHLVVQPDLIVVANARLRIVSDRVWGAPDLVVEVVSPHPRIGTLDERLGWFAEYGVREYWLVHQIWGQIEVVQFDGGQIAQRLFEKDEPLRSIVVPEFTASLASILRSAGQ